MDSIWAVPTGALIVSLATLVYTALAGGKKNGHASIRERIARLEAEMNGVREDVREIRELVREVIRKQIG